MLIKCGCKIDLPMLYANDCLRQQLIRYPLIEKILCDEVKRVKSLKEVCRLSIRKSLDQRLINKVNKLPLPTQLKDYILMKDMFTYSNTNNQKHRKASLVPPSPASSHNQHSPGLNPKSASADLNSTSTSSSSKSSSLVNVLATGKADDKDEYYA